MDILDVVVNYDTTMVDIGSCDADNISLITLLHAFSEKITGSEEVPSEEYCMWRAATDASSSQPAQGGGASSSQPLTVVQTQQQFQVTMHLD
ncbi:hypothetical protein Q3G72_019466 [Acer saccharum]|nr:hypothetical protein Q3G72_019466 [Acer saccharum]